MESTILINVKICKKISILVMLIFSIFYQILAQGPTCSCTAGNTVTLTNGQSYTFPNPNAWTNYATIATDFCFKVSGTVTINGTVTFNNGGKLYICPQATGVIVNFNAKFLQTPASNEYGGSIYLSNNTNTQINFTVDQKIQGLAFYNYATLTTQKMDIDYHSSSGTISKFVNYSSGKVTSTKDYIFNSGSTLTNQGTMSINNLKLDGTTTDFTNTGTFTTSGNFTRNNGTITNTGKTTVGGLLDLSSGGLVTLSNGVFYTNDLNITNTNLTGGTSCGVFVVTNKATSNCSVNTNSTNISVIDLSCCDNTVCGTYNSTTKPAYTNSANASTCAKTLPVEFTNVFVDQNQVIYWTTAQEKNNEKFLIQRSLDAIHFEVIGEVKGAGDSNHEIQYLFEDSEKYAGIVYYRIKQIDFDGSFLHSQVVVKNAEYKNIAIELFPNPVDGNELMISLSNITQQEITYEIVSPIGQIVSTQNVLTDKNVFQQKINITDYLEGVYLVKVKTGQNVFVQKMIIE